MKNSKPILSAAVAVSAILGIDTASAADLPVKALPPAAPAISWTGCYVGGNAGWVHGSDNYNTAPSGTYLVPAGSLAPPNAAGTGLNVGDVLTLSHSYNTNSSGGLIGAQAGCNQQTGSFVLGIETDWQWTSLRNSVDTSYGAFPDFGNPSFANPAHTEHVSSSLRSFGTIRGRGGFDYNHVFFYGTGGLAIGEVRSDTNITFGTFPVSPVFNGAVHVGSDSQITVGWTAGVGAEYMFAPNWSIKAEYLYVDLGTYAYRSPLVSAVAPAVVGPNYAWQTSVRDRENIVRVGVNYRFNWAGPVVAKY